MILKLLIAHYLSELYLAKFYSCESHEDEKKYKDLYIHWRLLSEGYLEMLLKRKWKDRKKEGGDA